MRTRIVAVAVVAAVVGSTPVFAQSSGAAAGVVGFGFLLLLLWIVFGCFTAAVANEKGFSGGMWFVGGLFFGPIALIAAAGMPDRVGQPIAQQRRDQRAAAAKADVPVSASAKAT